MALDLIWRCRQRHKGESEQVARQGGKVEGEGERRMGFIVLVDDGIYMYIYVHISLGVSRSS